MTIIKYIVILIFTIFTFTCNGEKKQKVPLEQLNIDKSNNYKYIFKDLIEEEKRKEAKEKKDPFQD